MNNLTNIFFFTILVTLTSCVKIEKKVITSNNEKNQLTILKFDDGKYLVEGEYNSDKKPNTAFIKGDLYYEYHTGLAKWTENRLEIYSQYGTFDTKFSDGKIKMIKISTKEFEELKTDTTQYTYFYY